ncbi:Fis family transcriptional regulator [Mycobacteroides abscessus subsp. abscessus]|nr:Fis family transcriptional regulator [Mycobacteroides abscessus subsp. abscessus]
MRTKHITSRGDVVGVVAVLDEDRFGNRGADETDSRIASLPTISAGGMRSPSWISAYNEVAHSLTRNTSVIVLGEPGSGRLSILMDAFRIDSPAAPIVVIDAADPRQTTSLPIPADGRGLLVLRHIDSLPAQVPRELRSVIDDAVAAGYILAATSSSRPSTTATTYGGLVARFDHSVTLPPLRLRGPDLQLLVDRILKSIAPQRNTRISPQAMRVISAYSWPQNLTQLHTALESALHRRPVGEIQPEDLPGFCRTTAHRVLTTLEIAERDAIVRVLGESGGNRARAAQVLGMSRSSIYRKIHTYGITGV